MEQGRRSEAEPARRAVHAARDVIFIQIMLSMMMIMMMMMMMMMMMIMIFLLVASDNDVGW